MLCSRSRGGVSRSTAKGEVEGDLAGGCLLQGGALNIIPQISNEANT